MTVWAVQNTVMVPQKISWQGKEESRSQEAPVLLSETVKEGIWTLHRLALGLDKPCVIKPENLNPYEGSFETFRRFDPSSSERSWTSIAEQFPHRFI